MLILYAAVIPQTPDAEGLMSIAPGAQVGEVCFCESLATGGSVEPPHLKADRPCFMYMVVKLRSVRGGTSLHDCFLRVVFAVTMLGE